MTFNTSYSYDVQDSFNQLKSIHDSKKCWSEEFHILFAYKFVAGHHDTWMHDSEGGMIDMVYVLVKL